MHVQIYIKKNEDGAHEELSITCIWQEGKGNDGDGDPFPGGRTTLSLSFTLMQ